MARIAGIDLPKNKRGEIGLTYIYGIGRSMAQKILDQAGISYDKKVSEWNDDELGALRGIIGEMKVEGALRSEVTMNIKRLMDIGCYRGIRHRIVCRSAARARRTTLVLVRVVRKLLPTRRKQPSSFNAGRVAVWLPVRTLTQKFRRIWQKIPKQPRKKLSELMRSARLLSMHLLIMLSCPSPTTTVR